MAKGWARPRQHKPDVICECEALLSQLTALHASMLEEQGSLKQNAQSLCIRNLQGDLQQVKTDNVALLVNYTLPHVLQSLKDCHYVSDRAPNRSETSTPSELPHKQSSQSSRGVIMQDLDETPWALLPLSKGTYLGLTGMFTDDKTEYPKQLNSSDDGKVAKIDRVMVASEPSTSQLFEGAAHWHKNDEQCAKFLDKWQQFSFRWYEAHRTTAIRLHVFEVMDHLKKFIVTHEAEAELSDAEKTPNLSVNSFGMSALASFFKDKLLEMYKLKLQIEQEAQGKKSKKVKAVNLSNPEHCLNFFEYLLNNSMARWQSLSRNSKIENLTPFYPEHLHLKLTDEEVRVRCVSLSKIITHGCPGHTTPEAITALWEGAIRWASPFHKAASDGTVYNNYATMHSDWYGDAVGFGANILRRENEPRTMASCWTIEP